MSASLNFIYTKFYVLLLGLQFGLGLSIESGKEGHILGPGLGEVGGPNKEANAKADQNGHYGIPQLCPDGYPKYFEPVPHSDLDGFIEDPGGVSLGAASVLNHHFPAILVN